MRPRHDAELEVEGHAPRIERVVRRDLAVVAVLVRGRVDGRAHVAAVEAQVGAEVGELRADGEPAEEVGPKLRADVDGDARGGRVPDALLDELDGPAEREALGDGAAVAQPDRHAGRVEGLAGAVLVELGADLLVGHAEQRHARPDDAAERAARPRRRSRGGRRRATRSAPRRPRRSSSGRARRGSSRAPSRR